MTYQEAEEKSFTVEWELDTCSQGESCWCRVVKPVEPILFEDGDTEEEFYIVGMGMLHKEFAEYFVKLHNQTLKTKEKWQLKF